jgi:hypothetical protein
MARNAYIQNAEGMIQIRSQLVNLTYECVLKARLRDRKVPMTLAI